LVLTLNRFRAEGEQGEVKIVGYSTAMHAYASCSIVSKVKDPKRIHGDWHGRRQGRIVERDRGSQVAESGDMDLKFHAVAGTCHILEPATNLPWIWLQEWNKHTRVHTSSQWRSSSNVVFPAVGFAGYTCNWTCPWVSSSCPFLSAWHWWDAISVRLCTRCLDGVRRQPLIHWWHALSRPYLASLNCCCTRSVDRLSSCSLFFFLLSHKNQLVPGKYYLLTLIYPLCCFMRYATFWTSNNQRIIVITISNCPTTPLETQYCTVS
jgi:hypothetical protein